MMLKRCVAIVGWVCLRFEGRGSVSTSKSSALGGGCGSHELEASSILGNPRKVLEYKACRTSSSSSLRPMQMVFFGLSTKHGPEGERKVNHGVEARVNYNPHILRIDRLVCDCDLTLNNRESNALSEGGNTCG